MPQWWLLWGHQCWPRDSARTPEEAGGRAAPNTVLDYLLTPPLISTILLKYLQKTSVCFWPLILVQNLMEIFTKRDPSLDGSNPIQEAFLYSIMQTHTCIWMTQADTETWVRASSPFTASGQPQTSCPTGTSTHLTSTWQNTQVAGSGL